MSYNFFTSESVSAGHPDKICDQISDACLDAALAVDTTSRVAVETLVTRDKIVLAGEVTCRKTLNFEQIARRVIKSLDYTNPLFNFTDKSDVEIFIHQQSPDIAVGADTGGAGDQGMMFGYASNETPELMPLPIVVAHRLVEAMDLARVTKSLPYLRPDGKSEVMVKYHKNRPVSVNAVVLAVPHDPQIASEQVHHDLYHHIVLPVLDKYGYKIALSQLIVNGTGRWDIGGPATDTGVTGRKIIVDSYGGFAHVGGGAFSGKDPTKVDRSGAYAARYIAKNIVSHQFADRCEVQLAYVIGYPKPLTVSLDTFGTHRTSLPVLRDFAFNKLLDLSVKGIISDLDLLRPIYQETARYGHFGRVGFPWEIINQSV